MNKSGSLSPSKKKTNNVDKGKTIAEAIDTLVGKLPNRPTPEDVERSGFKRSSDLADTLQPVASQIEKKIVEKRVSQSLKLKNKIRSPKSKKLMASKSSVANSLAAQAKNLEMKINADNISHFLGNRPSKDELRAVGVVNNSDTTSDRISQMQKLLETNIKRDHVGHLLESRPKHEDLKHITGMDDPSAPSIQGRRRSLEFGISKSQVARQLMERADYRSLLAKGLVAPVGEENENNEGSLTPQAKIAVALRCATRLHQLGMIDEDGKGYLKNLILENDPLILAALDVFESDNNLNELLDTMHRVALTPSKDE